MPTMSYIEAITSAMREEMERDDNVFVLGEDVGVKGGVFTTTKGLYEQFGEMRELCDREIRSKGCLATFLAYDTDANICGLNHRHIIATITDASRALPRVRPYEQRQ